MLPERLAFGHAPTRLRVQVFAGAKNWAPRVAQHQGFSRTQGLGVGLRFTQNTTGLRPGMAAAELRIAPAAVDNAMAQRQSAGAAVVTLSGSDNRPNER